jgi:hypothetical protein
MLPDPLKLQFIKSGVLHLTSYHKGTKKHNRKLHGQELRFIFQNAVSVLMWVGGFTICGLELCRFL